MILPPSAENIRLAAKALADGLLVGLPTETVYGIAADAFNSEAVATIFTLKGRPAENPLIVHLASVEEIPSVAAVVPECVGALANSFWPGPLTLVLRKRPEVPDIVTANLQTVAVRVPSHPVAQAVISAFGGPVAAPSANRFMGVSPTQAVDIAPDISVGLACVLDGGPCGIGIESTVLDVSGPAPRLLRLGHVTRAEIEAVVGPVLGSTDGGHTSPGMYPRHYAPKARVLIVERASADSLALVLGTPRNEGQISMPFEAAAYAAALYAALNTLDRQGVMVIEIEAPPKDWEAVWDRITKASSD